MIEDPAVGLFLDMGLGKTVITLTAINDLRFNRVAIGKTLIIAPKSVALATWTDEAAKWKHLQNLRIHVATGDDKPKQRLKILNDSGDIWVINRENTKWLVDQFKDNWPFDCVIFDESSSFKNPSSQRFKAIKTVLPQVRRSYILTGTPSPNGYHDLWAQIYLLDRGERLHKNITAYRTHYFNHHMVQTWHEYEIKQGAPEAINKKLQDICISMKAEDYLELPDLIIDDIPVQLTVKARKQYKEFERDAVLELIEEERAKGYITASSAGVLTNKLLQFCGGAVYDENGGVQDFHTCKMEAFSELIEQLNGKPVLVFYSYRHELSRLKKLLAKNFKHLRVREFKTVQDQKDWNDKKIDVLLAHPASTAYGLNLQKGGNHIIWFSLNWSLELYQQANKRLHRQGQDQAVIIHRLLVKGSKDEDVAKALEGKGDVQQALIDSLKAKIDEVKKAG